MDNVVEKFKKGNKIHIKESQKGSFTKWCGGNVTSECIQRGKNSSNPKIRKKATFAANARKWKHRFGGQINKFQQGGAGWGQLASGVVNAGMQLYAANKQANAEKESAYANNKLNYQNLQEQIVKDAIEKMNQEKKKWQEQYLSGQSLDNSWRSDAFTNYVQQQIINQKLVGAKNKQRQADALAEAKAENDEADAMNSAFSSVIQNGLGTLISNLGNRKIINSSVNSTNNSNINSNNFWDNPTIKNSQVTGDFWNNPTIANSLS